VVTSGRWKTDVLAEKHAPVPLYPPRYLYVACNLFVITLIFSPTFFVSQFCMRSATCLHFFTSYYYAPLL